MIQMKKEFKQIYLKNLVTSIAILSGIATLSMVFLSAKVTEWVRDYEWYYIIGFILFNLFIAGLMSISKKQICLKLNHNTTAHIFVGDLFTQSGIIIIPVNEYFDTLVGENVVSEDTLHGKFINQYFANNISELDNKMNLALSNIIFEIDDERPIGKNKKYPLGTTIEIKKDDKTFFLVVLTNFNENNRASVSKSKYQEVLAKLFDFIEQFSQGKIVNLPLIGGSNRAGLDISLQKRLECIILTALFRNQLSLGILNIVLTEKTLKEINLNKIDLIIDAIK